MSKKARILLGLGLYIGLIVMVFVLAGSSGENTHFKPQNEFKLDKWFGIVGPLEMNKAVMYVLAAGFFTVVSMIWVARKMQEKPNRVQTLVEMAYGLMRNDITGSNMEPKMAAKWFPFVATIFLFIWWSNMLGYIPLPTNTEHSFELFGQKIPSFALYAATANLSVPLVLAIVVWLSFTVEGIRAKGLIGYLKSLIPAGVKGPMAGFLFVLELFSNIMRLMSLSVRLFANILAGHLIIMFMAGALAVLLGVAALGVVTLPVGVLLFVFEVGLVATLQAFIFATLTAIYLGSAVADEH